MGLRTTQRFGFDLAPLVLLFAIAVTGLALTASSLWWERLKSVRAGKTSRRRWKQAKEHSRELNRKLFKLDAQGTPKREYRARRKEMDGH